VRADRAVIVLDDDPTGTQSAAAVPVLLDPAADPRAVLNREHALYVLTNTRAVPAGDAVELLAIVRRNITAACAELGLRPEFVLRGDSTLRGHVFPESDAFGARDGVLLLVPAFPEGGRATVDGVHYLQADGRLVPVADTEFARDPVFGYRARTLPEWVRETGGRPGISIPLSRVRADGVRGVAAALAQAPAGSVVVPDARTESDLEIISDALDLARAGGRNVVLRCAATLAAIRAGRRAPGTLPRPVAGLHRPRTLIACGSHTAASGRQLGTLCDALDLRPRLLDTGAALADPGGAGAGLAAGLRADLHDRGVAVLASARERRPEHNRLEHGAAVMTALCAAANGIAGLLEAVIAKGGITSAEIARQGLGASAATVLGPVLPGVPAWRLASGYADNIKYAVVPGNVGDDQTLVEVARAFAIL
jgi:uncharacterized protein YgbK (DUF1537 family)